MRVNIQWTLELIVHPSNIDDAMVQAARDRGHDPRYWPTAKGGFIQDAFKEVRKNSAPASLGVNHRLHFTFSNI